MKNKTLGLARLLLLASVLVTLAGCAISQSDGRQTEDETATFPEPDDAWVEQGTYADIDRLRHMQLGLSKDQVYDLLGRPHFSEGLFGVHEWNYLFHLPEADGTYRTCQYQVHFDDDMLTEGLYWRDDACDKLVHGKTVKRLTLSADTLFAFDSAQLSAKGQSQVAELAKRIQNDFIVNTILVTGYTDRLGSQNYNQVLSERRANAVRRALIDNGIAAMAIRSQGDGESHSSMNCDDELPLDDLKSCLSPDRRVEIEVIGEKQT